jgi:transcription elongation factor/antiterminator RfaH
MRRWYAVQTQPRKERLALLHLERQSFTAYCAFVRRPQRAATRVRNSLQPLFPNYLFVSLDCHTECWRSINGTIGVSRLISFSNAPWPLPSGFVGRLNGLHGSDEEAFLEFSLQEGGRVCVVGGALDDVCGMLATASARQRVTVLLETLSGETRVSLPRDRVVAA